MGEVLNSVKQDYKKKHDELETWYQNTTSKVFRAEVAGEFLKKQKDWDDFVKGECTHHKGGNFDNYLTGQGTDNQYAVIKHQFPWGDTWVICMRCSKTWKPPIKSKYDFKYGMNRQYNQDYKDYLEALDFPTMNQTSTAIQFENCNVKAAREATKDF